MLKHIWRLITKLWSYFSPQPANLEITEAVTDDADDDDELVALDKSPRRKRGFKADFLNHLNDYFYYLNRLRVCDRHSFNLYSKVGAHIRRSPHIDPAMQSVSTRLEPWWKENRPSFGALFFNPRLEEEEKEMIWPIFFYFTKHKTIPENIQPFNDGDFYTITAYFDTRKHKKFKWMLKTGTPVEFCVAIKSDGEVIALKTRNVSWQRIEAKKSKKYSRAFSVKQLHWGFHDFYNEWAKEHNMDTGEYLAEIFTMAANMFAHASHEVVQIRAKKGNMCAIFTIDPTQSSYFFNDRETVTDKDGKSKRIFHSVKPHQRSTGKAVKMHFRGLRDFVWNGYNIHISVPFREHIAIAEFNAPARFEDEIPVGEKMLDEKALAKFLLDVENKGRLLLDNRSR